MESGIFLEIIPAAYDSPSIGSDGGFLGYKHAYLIYRKPDGTSEVIRGGWEISGLNLEIEVETGKSLKESRDRLEEDEEPSTRPSRRLDIPPEKWDKSWKTMRGKAEEIDKHKVDYRFVKTSNSIVRAGLDAIDYPINKALPEGISKDDIPGFEGNLEDEMREIRQDRVADEKFGSGLQGEVGGWPGEEDRLGKDKPEPSFGGGDATEDTPEIKRLISAATKAGDPAEEILIKEPKSWTRDEWNQVKRFAVIDYSHVADTRTGTGTHIPSIPLIITRRYTKEH